MTQRGPVLPALGPLEAYCVQFVPLVYSKAGGEEGFPLSR